MNQILPPRRYFGLDMLRAGMMFLGVVYHAVQMIYSYEKNVSSPTAALFLWLCHALRMPLFFLLSGFLASLILEKKGSAAFLKGRLRRLAYPFFFFMLTVLPLVHILDGLRHEFFEASAVSLPQALEAVPAIVAGYFAEPMVHHLWFLANLFLYSMGLLLINSRLPHKNRFWVGAALLLSQLLCLIFMRSPVYVSGAGELVPSPAVFIYYGVPFYLGAYLHRERISFNGKWLGIFMFAASLGFLFLGVQSLPIGFRIWWPLSAGKAFAAAIFLGSVLVTSFYLFFRAKNWRVPESWLPALDYAVRSSFWVYVVHPIFLYGFFLVGKNLSIGPALQATGLAAGGLILSIATYHLLVRPTFLARWIG